MFALLARTKLHERRRHTNGRWCHPLTAIATATAAAEGHIRSRSATHRHGETASRRPPWASYSCNATASRRPLVRRPRPPAQAPPQCAARDRRPCCAPALLRTHTAVCPATRHPTPRPQNHPRPLLGTRQDNHRGRLVAQGCGWPNARTIPEPATTSARAIGAKNALHTSA